MEKMKIGECFFINIKALAGWSIMDFELKLMSEMICRDGGDKVNNYINNIPYEDFLIAVKYIGNGVCEEMITHEKLVNNDFHIMFENSDEKLLEDYKKDIIINLNYEDYVIDYKNYAIEQQKEFESQLKLEPQLSKGEYVELLQETMKTAIDYPLTLKTDTDEYFYTINENTKKTYLKHTDEERKKIITEAKKMALLDAKEVTSRIEEKTEKMKTISNQELDMAYLENQLYDFENEGKSK